MSLHRSRTTEKSGVALPKNSKSSYGEIISTIPQHVGTPHSHASIKADERAMSKRVPTTQTRPSALPRSASSSSQARLSYIASSRPPPTFTGKSPPTQARSLPYLDTSGRNRPITNAQQTMSPLDMDEDTVLGVVMPASTSPPTSLPPRLIPELQALAASGRRPSNGRSSVKSVMSSPSTQFTASSSPWSASTAATTPISWSSVSPNMVQSTGTVSKRSHTVPVPSTSKTRIPKIPVLPDSQKTAGNSAVASDSNRGRRPSRKLNPPTPSLPERSSSLHRNRSGSESVATTTSSSRKQSVPNVDLPKFPVPPISSSVPLPQTEHGPGFGLSGGALDTNKGHDRLQEALKKTRDLGNSANGVVQLASATEYAPRPRHLLEPLPVVQTTHRRLPSLSRRHQRTASVSEPESEKSSARSRLAKFSRIALFGRGKPASDTAVKPNKLQSRKGPAAGTGHEGYGKFGRKTKKASVGSSSAATDSDSSLSVKKGHSGQSRRHRISTSSQEQSDLDDFASSRMKPIPILGGSQRDRMQPLSPVYQGGQNSDTSLNTITTTESYPTYSTVAFPERRERFPPQESLEEPRTSLASRRSQRLETSSTSFRFPQPIGTRDLATTPRLDSRNTTHSSDVPSPSSTHLQFDAATLEKQQSKPKRSKWNIFRRKNSIGDSGHGRSNSMTRPGVSVDVIPAQAHRAVPFYAMSGSETDVTHPTSIGQLLREAAESPEKRSLHEHEEMVPIGFYVDDAVDDGYASRESVLLPTAPARVQPVEESNHMSTSQSFGHLPTPIISQRETANPKQSRLAQVGRIPPVISTKQQSPSPSFAVDPSHQPAAGRLRRKASRDRLPRLLTSASDERGAHMSTIPFATRPLWQQELSQRAERDREFLRYADTRNSDFTTSSESTGLISIAAPPSLQQPFGASRPTAHLMEDEVWNEYDDYLDDIMSPASTITSPRKQKKPRTTVPVKSIQHLERIPKDSGVGLAIIPSSEALSTDHYFLAPPPIPLSSMTSLSDMDNATVDDIRLRRSRIAAALHASYAPSSPFSMRDFIDEYDQRGSGKYSERLSGSSARATTPKLPMVSTQRTGQQREYDNSAQLEQAKRIRNPTKHSDQLYASLMVARWLSFGRVLFSPAHQDVEICPERHILVIDGLGNEDWAIYCAVTYQSSRAYVHDIKEQRPGKQKAFFQNENGSAPSNFRRSEVASFNDKFPFPPEFFSAIVIRFPPAMPGSKLRNIVSECQRVLAPEGYLELMILDLDIVNMGVQTRKSIKDLKIKLTTTDRTVSLKPLIDNVQTVLGSNGFSNLNRCVVGVPVVGRPVNSIDSSSESRSSTDSAGMIIARPDASKSPYGRMNQANFSLNDLVADHSENADAKIGKMVSRTARSWWQHCFEAGFVADGGRSKSVFANKDVLSECKSRASSFKLLIAYTQKSSMGPQRRRTMSEPGASTLAIARAPQITQRIKEARERPLERRND